MKNNKNEIARIKNILRQDVPMENDKFEELLNADVFEVLKNYFEIIGKPVCKIGKRGDTLDVSININASAIKNFIFLPKPF